MACTRNAIGRTFLWLGLAVVNTNSCSGNPDAIRGDPRADSGGTDPSEPSTDGGKARATAGTTKRGGRPDEDDGGRHGATRDVDASGGDAGAILVGGSVGNLGGSNGGILGVSGQVQAGAGGQSTKDSRSLVGGARGVGGATNASTSERGGRSAAGGASLVGGAASVGGASVGGASSVGGSSSVGGTVGTSTQATCNPQCALGTTKCDGPNRFRICVSDPRGCRVWGDVKTCTGSRSCDTSARTPESACVCPATPAQCAGGVTSSPTCTSATTVERCTSDASGCIRLETVETCVGGKSCLDNGATAKCSCPSVPSECVDRLLLLGGTFCTEDGALGTCAFSEGGCLTFSKTDCDLPRRCVGPVAFAACYCPSSPACR
ncbi:MAG: hypothetical protein QM784_31265 [Polyangiaceae bacterium]